MKTTYQKWAVFIFGILFVVALMVLAIAFPNPTPFQYTVFRVVLALAAAGFGAMIPGVFDVRVGVWLKAGGTLAIFVIVYFYNPASLIVVPKSPTIGESTHITRKVARFGIPLGWQLGRYEFVDDSPFPEAQAVAPDIKRQIEQTLTQDGFPHSIDALDASQLINTILSYYNSEHPAKHACILVGIGAMRFLLVGASEDPSANTEIRQLAYSTSGDIDSGVFPRKDEFFRALESAQLNNANGVVELLVQFVESSDTGFQPAEPGADSTDVILVDLTVWSETDTDIYVDGRLVTRVDHHSGFDYAGTKTLITPKSSLTAKSPGFEKKVALWHMCDPSSRVCEVRIGTGRFSSIQISDEEKRAAMGDLADVPTLVRDLLESPKYSARAWAAERLGYIGGPEAVKGLIEALGDLEPYVQANAAAALGQIGDASVLPKLESVYSDYSKKESYGWMFEAAIRDLKAADVSKPQ